MKVFIAMLIAAAICFLIGVLVNVVLNDKERW